MTNTIVAESIQGPAKIYPIACPTKAELRLKDRYYVFSFEELCTECKRIEEVPYLVEGLIRHPSSFWPSVNRRLARALSGRN